MDERIGRLPRGRLRPHLLLPAVGCALALLVSAGRAAPFHPDGDGRCGCHVMHQSENDIPVAAGPKLLRGMSSTDLCLSCHATANGAVLARTVTQPSAEIGAGNFIFLLEDNLNDDPNTPGTVITGNHAGHNVVAPAYGIQEDTDHRVAPGGTFLARDLGCTSCHDPHGGGNYRMLHGAGPVQGGIYAFAYPAPEAEGIPLTEREGADRHTAYRSGWSRWCSNCHSLFHEQGFPDFEHPADRGLGGNQRDSYNQYRGETNPTGGDQASAYLPEVPYEDPIVTTSTRSGPNSSSRVTCMSCHRAHATSAPESTRWDKTVLYLDQDGSASGSYPIPNPYPGPAQRALCIKCHVEKTRDHGLDRPCLECHGQGSL